MPCIMHIISFRVVEIIFRYFLVGFVLPDCIHPYHFSSLSPTFPPDLIQCISTSFPSLPFFSLPSLFLLPPGSLSPSLPQPKPPQDWHLLIIISVMLSIDLIILLVPTAINSARLRGELAESVEHGTTKDVSVGSGLSIRVFVCMLTFMRVCVCACAHNCEFMCVCVCWLWFLFFVCNLFASMLYVTVYPRNS